MADTSKKIDIEITARLKGVEDSFGRLEKKLADAGRAYDGVKSKAEGLGRSVAGLAAIAGIGISVGEVVGIIKEFEGLAASLKTVTGSMEDANLAARFLQRFAATTPFDLQQVTEAFIRLKSLGLDSSEASLRSFGNTAAAMNKSLMQYIEAVADAATGEFERLKEFGIKASQNGDQVTFTFRGVSTTVQKEAGAITAYLKKIGDTDFATGMADQANTVGGKLSNLKDQFSGFVNFLAGLGISDALKTAIGGATDVLAAFQKQLNGIFGDSTQAAIDAYEQRIAEMKGVIGDMRTGQASVPLVGRMLFTQEEIDKRTVALHAMEAQLERLKAFRDSEQKDADARMKTVTAPMGGQPPATGAGAGGAKPKATPYDAQFAAAEAKYSLPTGLLKSVADIETGGRFNPQAVSPAGARGLMQFMPGTAARFGLADPFNAEAAIGAAGQYFRQLLDLFKGDLVKAIAAYNAGEGAVQKHGLDTVLSDRYGKGETKSYVPKVLGKLEDYGNLVGYQDKAEADIRDAERRRKLADEERQFEGQQRLTQAESTARYDEIEKARLEAAYQAKRLSAEEYYRQLDSLQGAASKRMLAALQAELEAERQRQAQRISGTEEYLQGEERIFALQQKIAQTATEATVAGERNRLALAQAQREQGLALTDQLAQLKLRLLELSRPDGPNLVNALVPPESQELFAQRVKVLEIQYREFLDSLRRTGDSEGVATVKKLINAEAMQGLNGEMDQATQFGIQAARNIQTGFANFLFDPFKDGLRGMLTGFLDTLRRMAAEAASAQIMRLLLGKDFEKGKAGGLLGDAIDYFKGGKTAADTKTPKTEAGGGAGDAGGGFGDILNGFKTGFEQIFNGDFFTGLGSLFKNGLGGVLGGLASLIGSLFRGGSASGGAVGDAITALKLAGSVVGLFGGGGGGVDASAPMGGLFHQGGLVGLDGERRRLPAIALASAPRYHSGGLAGLKPNEVPAILMGGPRGQREEVLRADDPRHQDNLLDGGRRLDAVGGQPPQPTVNVVNVLDPALVGSFLNTKEGERLVLNVLRRNPSAVQRMSNG